MKTVRKPRVLLATPPYHAGVVESAGVWMPLGLAYLAGHARAAGAEVALCDAMGLFKSHDQIGLEIDQFQPDIIGVTAITGAMPDALKICEAAKQLRPEVLTVLGNVHPTFMWRQLLTDDENVDVIACGEGEETIADLVRAVAAADDLEKVAGIAYRRHGMPHRTRPRAWADIDQLHAAWDLIEWSKYYYRPSPEGSFAIVSSSRGCAQACSFCSQQKFWERSWRGRDPEQFVTELEMLRDTYDVRTAMLSDETPTVNRDRWERVLDLLSERQVGVELLMETRVDDIVRDEDILPKYRKAGVSHIYVGVEAVDQSTLDLYNKDTKVAESKRAIELINAEGIISETSFVLGTPDETAESIKRTVDLAIWYEPDMAFFLAITPWPYADLYPDLKDHIATHDYSKYNLVEPVVKPEAMTLDEVRFALFTATGRFFHDKFERLDQLPEAKREYMVTVLKLLIEHSYLGTEMAAMAAHASMPPQVKKMLDEIGIDFAKVGSKAAG